MSKVDVGILKKYLQFRQDAGDDGFWIDPERSSSRDGVRINKSLNEIEKTVFECKKCPLGNYRLNPCFGNGNPMSRIMFIGEGPGYDEDHSGIVFIGRAGKLLDRILEVTLNLKRSDVYITNIIKCHAMKEPARPHKRGNDRPPTPKETSQCIPYLIQQIDLIKPRVIVALGSPAAKTILNTDKGITSLRGKVFDVRLGKVDTKVVCIYHPAYLLRYPSKKEEVIEDTKIIRSLL